MSARTASVPSKLLRMHKDGRLDTYIVGELLGRGGFGTVHKVMHLERGETYALKATPLYVLDDEIIREKLKEEVELQRSLDHPNILKAYDRFQDEFNYYIVLELCPHSSVKSLFVKRGALTEPEAADILYQVLEGVKYLHEHQIIHRDLKLENFLISSNGQIKIADFGISKRLEDDNEKRHSMCGTVGYISPEMLGPSREHSYEVDIWALGVCAFTLITGKPPFETRNKELTYAHIRACKYRFPTEKRFSFLAKDFIQNILRTDPGSRPCARDLILHPFLVFRQTKGFRPIQLLFLPKPDQPVERHVKQFRFMPKKNKEKENKDENVQPEEKKESVKAPVIEERKPIQEICDANDSEVPDYCVSRYCDKTSKYGLGYMLINGCVGAVFADYSRMIMDPYQEFVQYYPDYLTKSPKISKVNETIEVRKLSILMKFYRAMKSTQVNLPEVKPDPVLPLRHVKYWMKQDDRILFRMDDRLMQVNFKDKTKFIIFWTAKRFMNVQNVYQRAKTHSFRSINAEHPMQEKYNIVMKMIDTMNQQ